jgi:CheY-like chemotaxis protein
LITDLRMPGASGLDLIRWVRKMSPDTRTMLITGYGNEQIKAEAQRLEVSHYLTKPFEVKDFTRLVAGTLEDCEMPTTGLVSISDQVFDFLVARIERLRQETGALCVFVSDMQGQRLVEVGHADELDATMLLTLLAGGFATSAELARRLGNDSAVNLLFQEGDTYDVYGSNVGDSLILALAFEKHAHKSRVGMVWLYTRRAVNDLQEMLADPTMQASAQELETGFQSSMMDELDTAFGGATEIARPARQPPSGGSVGGSERAEHPAVPRPHDGQARELLSLEDAIGRGLLPPDFGT